MRVHPWHTSVPVGLLILLPLLGFTQDSSRDQPQEEPPETRREPIYVLGTTQFRHLGDVLNLEYSPDGTILASGGGDGYLMLWDAGTGGLQRRLDVGPRVSAFAFSADGRSIVAGAGSGQIASGKGLGLSLWDVASGEKIRTFDDEKSEVTSAAFTPDGKKIVLGVVITGGTGQVHIWDVEGGALLHRLFGHESRVNAVAVAPDGKLMASAGQDPYIRLWDPVTGEKRGKLALPHRRTATSDLDFSPDGARIASAHEDVTVRLWDVGQRRLLHSLAGHLGPVEGVAFFPDGKSVASSGSDRNVCIWDGETGKLRRKITQKAGFMEKLMAMAFVADKAPLAISPDGKTIAAGGARSVIRRWDQESGKELNVTVGHRSYIVAMAFSPDGKRIATGGGDKTIRLWDIRKRKEIQKLHSMRTGSVHTVAFSPDGKTLASAGQEPFVELWDPASGKQLRFWGTQSSTGMGPIGAFGNPWSERSVKTISYTRDGKFLFASATDGTVWRLDPGRAKKVRFQQAAGEDPSEAFWIQARVGRSSDDRSLLSGPDFQSSPWEETLALTPGRQMIISRSSSRSIDLRDRASGKLLLKLVSDSPEGQGVSSDSTLAEIASLAVSSDGRLLAVADKKGKLRIWELASGQALRTWRHSRRRITALVFSPNGRLLVTANEDKEIHLVDPRSGVTVEKLGDTGEGPLCLAFSPDGFTLAAGGLEGIVRLWDVRDISPPPPTVGENLTPGEIRELLRELAQEDAIRAYVAMQTLEISAELCLPFIEGHLLATAEFDPTEVRRQVLNLNHDDFAVRERADKVLRSLGGQVEAILKKTFEAESPPEVKSRIGKILDACRPPYLAAPSETLRRFREIAVLERIGSEDARKILQAAAKASAGRAVREEAHLAQERMVSPWRGF
ncbi:MAG: WD40 repeat domain-containing protein [Planctomycetota bacterium]|nr:WD40 repeat domain-containing protein [Planctomycetota bacterium]